MLFTITELKHSGNGNANRRGESSVDNSKFYRNIQKMAAYCKVKGGKNTERLMA